jgi:hypothetical protein
MNDPLAKNAHDARQFFDEHAVPDADPIFRQVAGDHAVSEIRNPVESSERDAEGRVVSLKLRPTL